MSRHHLWFKSAVIYQLDVRTFLDSDGDGWGDFQGLVQQLDYITSLGVTCIWLKPFNQSPNRDGGYDIVDYYSVDDRIGSFGDFARFMDEAAIRGLAVITELVINHTSSDHPWFIAAAQSRDSPHHDYYVWRDEPLSAERSPQRITFSEGDTGVWTYSSDVDQFYLHRFYPHEPDLDNAHPDVQEEVLKMLSFYLRLGVAGFRIDAAPYVAEKAAVASDVLDPHDYLKSLRDFISGIRSDAVFMAEADVDAERLDEYFGDGDEMNLLLNFLSSEFVFAALAEGTAEPLVELLDLIPRPPDKGQYANFLRNHDELDLERLSESQRRRVFEVFAPDEDMRIFGRGIRRRIAPMLAGDQARLRLSHSLLFAIPGTPIIYYGDEIGMGEDLTLEERNPVRTPMQWSAGKNGGFSAADEEDLFMLPIGTGPFRFQDVNVAEQTAQPDSMLNWMRRLIGARKQARPVAMGDWTLPVSGEPSVFAVRYDDAGDVALTYHNLSPEPRWVKFEIGDATDLYEVFADTSYGNPEPEAPGFEISGHGYRWLLGRAE